MDKRTLTYILKDISSMAREDMDKLNELKLKLEENYNKLQEVYKKVSKNKKVK